MLHTINGELMALLSIKQIYRITVEYNTTSNLRITIECDQNISRYYCTNLIIAHNDVPSLRIPVR